MNRDRIKWNERYARGDRPSGPSEIVEKFYRLAASGRALDIAAGNGRNSLFLAERGFGVDAVDISDAGLAHFAGRHPNLHAICADLEVFDIPPGRYELIVNTHYLNRRLLPQISEGLKPGGLLIFEALLTAPPRAGEERTCRDYLLGPNELLHAFLRLRIVYYRESWPEGAAASKPTAALVAVRPKR